MQRPRRPIVLLVAAAILFTFGLIGTLFFSDDEDQLLVIDDDIDDCREAGRDTGERCDAGADIERIALSLDGEGLKATFSFTEDPDVSSEILWAMEFFVELDKPVRCGLSNVFGDSEPEDTVSSYALDETGNAVGADACRGELDGNTAVFTIDLTGQPTDSQFRLLGSIKLDFPNNAQPGSEDDFLVRTSLDGVRAGTAG